MTTLTPRERYYDVSSRVPAHWADAAEQNATDQGLAPESDEWFAEVASELELRMEER